MAVTKKGNRTDANFPEELVGFALESFLSVLSFPSFRYSLEPFSRSRERWLGADARLASRMKSFAPIYMQFKRPTAYESASSAQVVRERTMLSLAVVPRTLFFALRDKQKHHFDYQHNILHRLSRRLRSRKLGDATYICPLFLDRSAYRLNVFLSALGGHLHWDGGHPYRVRDGIIHTQTGIIALRSVPAFAEHISIRPHAQVTNAKHYYSFTESGTDVCFHSPLSLPDSGESLASWLETRWNSFVSPETPERIPRESALEARRDLVEPGAEDLRISVPDEIFDTKDGVEAWHRFGSFLSEKYDIAQFGVVEWE